jgi:hypothetical protein
VKKRRKRSRKAKAGPKVWTGAPWGPSWGDQTQDEWEEEQRRGKVVFVGESENTRLLRMLVKQQKAQIAPAKPAKPEGGRKFREVRGVLPKLRDPDGKVLYPDGKVPDSVSTKTVLQQVIAELARPDRKYKVSWHTVNRALARE